MNFRRLPWDSEFFGREIGLVTGDPVAAAEEADAEGLDCLYCLLRADDADDLWASQGAGFRVVDTRLTLGRGLTEIRPPEEGVRSAADDDAAELEAIARSSFTDSRFYVDPNFSRKRCADLYAAWLHRGMESSERAVLVAGDREGFIVCGTDEEHQAGSIELIAVSTTAAGQGLGGSLVRAANWWFAAQGLERARVVTQARNLRAQWLYNGQGYKPIEIAVWLHRWRSGTPSTRPQPARPRL